MANKPMQVMNKDVHLLRESVAKITQMLAGKDLKVTQQGLTASVKTDKSGKPVSVNLPYIPDNASVELCQAVQGFLDKEVSSILFSDFTELKKIERNKELHGMAKRIEDTRIEKRMGEYFRGSKSNLSTTSQFFLDKYTQPKLDEAIAGSDEAQAQAVLMHPLIRMMAGFQADTDFMSDKMAIVNETYSKIKKFGPAIEACASTKEAINLARQIRKALSEDDEEDGEGEGDETGMSGAGGGGAGSGDGGEGEGDEEGSDGEDSRYYTEDSDNSTNGGEIKSQKTSCVLSAIDKENANSYDKEMANLITGDVTDFAKEAPYLVFSKENDVIEPLHVGSGYRPEMFTRTIQDATEHMVGPLQKDLERAISARSMAVWENGLKRGKLHGANLSRLRTGDSRVFRRKRENVTKDVAASIVIDLSGSMSGKKITTATQAAYAVSSVLERMRIPYEVIAFTTGSCVTNDRDQMHEDEKRLGRRFTRDESLYMPIVKGFGERIGSDVRARFGWLPNTSSMRNNVDGECVEIAARRLLQRGEQGKIMMVFSDGYPAASGDSRTLNHHLREVVLKTMSYGVDVIGIGIQSDSVQKFYPKNVVLNKIEELPSVVVHQLRALLLK